MHRIRMEKLPLKPMMSLQNLRKKTAFEMRFRKIFQTITKDSTTTSVSKKKFKQALMSIPSLGEMIASAEPALSPLLSGKGFAKKLDDIDGDKDAEITIDEMVDFCQSLSKNNN